MSSSNLMRESPITITMTPPMATERPDRSGAPRRGPTFDGAPEPPRLTPVSRGGVSVEAREPQHHRDPREYQSRDREDRHSAQSREWSERESDISERGGAHREQQRGAGRGSLPRPCPRHRAGVTGRAPRNPARHRSSPRLRPAWSRIRSRSKPSRRTRPRVRPRARGPRARSAPANGITSHSRSTIPTIDPQPMIAIPRAARSARRRDRRGSRRRSSRSPPERRRVPSRAPH